jgi:hypothetical protein
MDPQILCGPRYEVYLKRLNQCESVNVDVLEIYHFEVGQISCDVRATKLTLINQDEEPKITLSSLDNVQLQNWIDAVRYPFLFNRQMTDRGSPMGYPQINVAGRL